MEKKMTTTCADGNPDPGLGQALKRRIIIQTLNIHINFKKMFGVGEIQLHEPMER